MLVVFLFPFVRYQSFFHASVGLIEKGFFASIGGVILSLIYVYFTNKVKVHERGFLYGLLDEVETLAECITPVFVFNFLPPKLLSNLPFIFLIGAGLICIRKYKDIRKKNKIISGSQTAT
ncbi:MAG: hypothetical protein WCP39_00640 [Chlamydiota bacterium]